MKNALGLKTIMVVSKRCENIFPFTNRGDMRITNRTGITTILYHGDGIRLIYNKKFIDIRIVLRLSILNTNGWTEYFVYHLYVCWIFESDVAD